MREARHLGPGWAAALVVAGLLAGCASPPPAPAPAALSPAQVRAQIVQLLPTTLPDRAGWATDVYAALTALGIEPALDKVCAVLAVAEQESGFSANPATPGLPAITWREIDRRAEQAGVPRLLLHAALQLTSPNGQSYADRIDHARTERDLSELYEDFIGMVPLGRTLFAGYNPVRTAGPMQVSIAFAEAQVASKPYPYPLTGTVRQEVFSRRGGLYFGTAHLLDYPAGYDRPLYRFADFNAGRYASRNAAFQQAVSSASGIPLDLDGDLIDHRDGAGAGSTELALRTLGERLGLSPGAIRRDLEKGDSPDFDRSALARRVYELAEAAEGRPLPRAVVPRIVLHTPKTQRTLTTGWFTQRVDARFQRCMTRAAAL
jgi:hypothetical protein